MERALRSLVIIIATVGIIAAIGHMMQSPPRIFDAMTSATVRSGSESEENAQGTYLFGIKNDEFSSLIRNMMNDNSEESSDAVGNINGEKKYVIAVNEKEPLSEKYAGRVAAQCEDGGLNVTIKTYNETMLKSRMLAGKCDAFVVPMGFMDMDLLGDGAYEIQDVDSEQLTKD